MKTQINEIKRMQQLAGLQELKVPDFLQGKADEKAIKISIKKVYNMVNDIRTELLKPPYVVDDYAQSDEIKKLLNLLNEMSSIINKDILG